MNTIYISSEENNNFINKEIIADLTCAHTIVADFTISCKSNKLLTDLAF